MDLLDDGAAGPAGAPTPRPRGPAWWQQSKWRAFVAIGPTYLIAVLATSFTFLALPAIAEEFGVTLRAVGWVVILESLLIAALLLPMGGLADSIGWRRVLFGGMVVFGLGSLLTGLAPSFAVVIGARVVMALGNTLVQSVGTGMLAASFPASERGLALGAQTTAVAAGSALAPLIGGAGLELLPWNALFLLLLVPIGLSLAAILLLLPDDRTHRLVAGGRPFDRVGALLAALAVTALVVVVNNPLALPWRSPAVIGTAVVAVVLLVGFIRWELRVATPMLDLRLFALPVFRNAVAIRVVGFSAAATSMLLLPIYLLSARQVASSLAGLLIALWALGMGISAQVSGRFYDRAGPRPPSMIGLVLQTVVMLVLASADRSTSLVVIGAFAFLGGVAMAMWNVPNNSAMLTSTPPSSFGVGGAFTNVTRTVGSAVGQALATAVVAGVMAGQGFDIPLGELRDTPGAPGAFIDGWQLAYVIGAVITLVTFLFAWRLPSGQAEQR